MRLRAALPIAAGLGLLSALNFDPWSVPFTMLAAVAGLFWLLRSMPDASRRAVAAVGATYGVVFMGVLIWWMNAVSAGAWVALVLAETAFFALIAVLLRTVLQARGWPVWAAGAWVLGETVRGAFPFSGFPWGRLVHTAIDTPLAPFVRVLGMTGTSLLMAVLAACALLVATRRWLAAVPIAAALALGLVLPTGLAGATGQERTVAVVQGNTPGPFLQWPRSEIFQLHVEATERIDQPVDLVLWPENGSDLDPFTNAYARSELRRVQAVVEAPILVGAILDGPDEQTAYNAGVVVDETGPRDDFYVKRKPVPYGEYVPFRRQLGDLVPRFDRDIPRDLVGGDEPGALQVAGTVLGDTICWDVAYDDVVGGSIEHGAEMIVVQTSNASFMDFGRGTQPEQQFAISRLRAIETGRWVLVPSTNGVSGIIDAHGEVVERAPLKESATMIADVPLADGVSWGVSARTPAIIVATVLTLAGWAAGVRSGRRNR